jgi:hypothetical protein
MDRVISLTSFEEEQARNSSLEYWLSRPPEERIGGVERLRREYLVALQGNGRDGLSPRLCRSLLVVEREWR